MASQEIENLVQALAKLPGLGPRSARRAVLYLLKRPDTAMKPILAAMSKVDERLVICSVCGNVDTQDPCQICTDPRRDDKALCVVEEVSDLWALDKSRLFPGKFHVLGGKLSALEGQTPAHYIAERLENYPVRLSQLSHGIPVGGELDYLDEGTLAQALRSRRPINND